MDAKVVAPPARHRRRVLLVCGIAAIAISAATVTIAVTLVVYRVREPVMTMNAITMQGFSVASPSPRLTVVADVSVKNPNAATLRYMRSETAVYYRARLVGEAAGPPGTARAGRTVRLNLTLDVAVGALLGDPGFLGDVAAGAVAVTTATRVSGHVAVLGFVLHRVVLEMNCTVEIAVAAMSIRKQSCLQRVFL